VVANSFLSDGGDAFGEFTAATGKFFGGLDIDALSSYLAANDPYTPPPTDRITLVP
jgi:5'-nucleotidase